MRASTYDVAGKINLEEEKLAQAGYGVAMGKASLLEASGEQAKIGSYWTAASQAAKGLYYYDRAKGKELYPGIL